MQNKEQPKTLVLVVGAGASKEVNLPVGTELREQIADALDIRYEHGYHRVSGDGNIDAAFRAIARKNSQIGREEINPFLETSWRIRDAMPQAISIDNFIDSHRGNALIAQCGKLAIARCILAAELKSTIFIDRQRSIYEKILFSNVANTWYNSFFQLITENCHESEIDDRLAQVAIISFNYDRCIAHYIHGALENYYGMSTERAAQAMKNLRIYHPYGSVGSLPWQDSNGSSAPYGSDIGGEALVRISEGIKTFTEGIDPAHSSIIEIRETLAQASRIAFLGFAFHRLNLKLLFPGLKEGETVPDRPIYATGYGISNSDGHEIQSELSALGVVPHHRFHFRNDLTCAKLFTEYWRSLSLLH